MKKTVVKGICQTLILLIALSLISVQVLHLRGSAPDAYETGTLSAKQAEQINAQPDQDASSGLTMRKWLTQRLDESTGLSGIIYAGLFALIALYLLADRFPRENDAGSISRARILISAGLYLGCGIPFLITGYSVAAVLIMNILYSCAMVWEAWNRLKEKREPGHIVLVALLLVLALLNLVFLRTLPLFVLIIVALRSVLRILVISFSQIRLDILKKIIRKTYASEILIGMFLLMVAFSLLLTMLDPGFPTFLDAMWFCFATVTTIGYGDVAAATWLGRVLSVILGIYGIIVVALITSIIVNFYNEMKAARKAEPPETL